MNRQYLKKCRLGPWPNIDGSLASRTDVNLMRLISILGYTALFFFTNLVHAENSISFKKELVSNIHWFPYLLVLGFLFVVLFFLAKKSKGLIKANPKCQIIEKIPIHHKTKVYVIDYQGQRFLIADNQSALAIHPLHELSQPL